MIEKLDELLESYLGKNQVIIAHETARLVATGENYGSQILALRIHLKKKHKSRVLDAVAKIPPPGEFIRRMFNTPVTFRNEFTFYTTIVPELESFLREKDLEGYLDCFPEFFAGRLSSNRAESEVDASATLILENLKIKGYEMLDRNEGLDLPTSQALVGVLARFHAVPLGLKLRKPLVFNAKLRPLFRPYKVFDFDGSVFEAIVGKYRAIAKEACARYERRVVDAFSNTLHLPKNDPGMVREPLSTLIHTDAWINNFMMQYRDGVLTNCKMVDFQLYEYGSPLRDLVFFIFSSVQIPVIRKNYSDLIELYYGTFIDTLHKLGCESAHVSLEELEKEIEIVAKQTEFFHCMVMLEPIFATKDTLKELDDYSDEDMRSVRPVPPKHKERAVFIIEEFAKRNWI